MDNTTTVITLISYRRAQQTFKLLRSLFCHWHPFKMNYFLLRFHNTGDNWISSYDKIQVFEKEKNYETKMELTEVYGGTALNKHFLWRSSSSTSWDMIGKIQDIMINDLTVKVGRIAETMWIPNEPEQNILTIQLELKMIPPNYTFTNPWTSRI